jgi:phosphatidylserine decarboxylase
MIHKEGYPTLIIAFILFLSFILLSINNLAGIWTILISLICFVVYALLLWFFRNPTRTAPKEDNTKIIAPADGKVVVIEKVHESEYFKDERLQVSIFMSPLNVHVNRNPISGTVQMAKYHPGKYLAAWNPKSSTENERTTMVIKGDKHEVLFRQIAGALARRIVYYIKSGDKVKQGAEMGFIKFGSRVDLFLPLDSQINVKIGDIVAGAKTTIAELK